MHDDEQPTDDTDLLSKYNRALDKHPLIVKSLTAALVQGLGAALASVIMKAERSNGSKRHGTAIGSTITKPNSQPLINWVDVFAFALHGGLVNGPVGHYWFEWLSKHGPSSSFYSMLIDQLIVQPPLLAFMFVFLDATRAALRELKPSLGRTLHTVGPTIQKSWRFWPVAVFCTFRFLKRKHYTVALNLCSLAWTMYLSKESKRTISHQRDTPALSHNLKETSLVFQITEIC